jgi:alkanesulfonate monooxygenase SsuD/methylene tetrahydromethanopterin reductase-like flavin-dependent oxidoreductase (luciferase family)
VMRRSIVLAGGGPVSSLQAIAQQAEDAGLHRVWTTEGAGSDGMARALAIGLATSRIGIGTGIAYSFPRLPLHAAATVADTQECLGGRFTYGLGIGTRGIRRRYGIEEDHPAPRLGEYVDVVRAALHSTGSFEFSGRFYQCKAPVLTFDGDPVRRAATKIYGSGVNAIMLEHAAAHCDGVGLHPLAGIRPRYLNEVTLPALQRGSSKASWREHDLELALWYICSVHPDRAIARARAAHVLAFYFCTPSYSAPLAGTGFEGIATELQAAFRASPPPVDWESLAALIPAEMVDAICLAGTAAEVRARLTGLEDELAACGIGEIVLEPTSHGGPGAFAESCRGIIEAAGQDAAGARHQAAG